MSFNYKNWFIKLSNIGAPSVENDQEVVKSNDFEDFVLNNLPLSGISSIGKPNQYWILDKNDYIIKPDKARQILAKYISAYTEEEEKQRLMNEGGTFDVEINGSNWHFVFNGKPFNINNLLLRKMMSSPHREFVRIINTPPRMYQEAIEERNRRLTEGPTKTQRKNRPAQKVLDLSKMSSEQHLKFANIAGWLMNHTVYYVDEPQVKKRKLNDEQCLHYKLRPGATLRDLSDDQIVNLYYDLFNDYKFGDNTSGFNIEHRRAWPEFNALNSIFDRRTFQPHLEVKFNPPFFTAKTLFGIIGPLVESDSAKEGINSIDPDSDGIVIAWNIAVASFVDSFGISDYVPVKLEKGFEIDRILEQVRRGNSSIRQTLSAMGAGDACKAFIQSQVPEHERESIEVFFDFGAEGNLNFNELKTMIMSEDDLDLVKSSVWKYKFKH